VKPIISRCGQFVILLLVAFALSGCGAPAPTATRPTPEPTPAPEVDRLRIVVLGDSLAAGLGLPEAEAFPAVLEQMLREAGREVDVLNAGVSGDTSAGGLSRIDWVLKTRPEMLVVELGGNDALRGQPLENTDRNLRSIIARGRESGARVVLLGMDVPTNYGPDYAGAFAEMYKTIARDEEIVLVPGFVRELATDPALMQPDGLHPTAEGQRLLAERLFSTTRSIFSFRRHNKEVCDDLEM
jgi:acyl-CoA thioesterase-1